MNHSYYLRSFADTLNPHSNHTLQTVRPHTLAFRTDSQRQVIGEAFGCPVRESYGVAEIVATSTECDEGRLHL